MVVATKEGMIHPKRSRTCDVLSLIDLLPPPVTPGRTGGRNGVTDSEVGGQDPLAGALIANGGESHAAVIGNEH